MILSCVDTIPSLSGLTYFLTTSQRDGESSSLVEVYLQRCPECEHVLQPLGWGKERRTHDVVSSTCSVFVCTHLHMGHRACTHACGPHTSSCVQNHPKSSLDLTLQRVCSHFYYACWSVCNQDQDFGLAKNVLDCSLLKLLITWFITGQRSNCHCMSYLLIFTVQKVTLIPWLVLKKDFDYLIQFWFRSQTLLHDTYKWPTPCIISRFSSYSRLSCTPLQYYGSLLFLFSCYSASSVLSRSSCSQPPLTTIQPLILPPAPN